MNFSFFLWSAWLCILMAKFFVHWNPAIFSLKSLSKRVRDLISAFAADGLIHFRGLGRCHPIHYSTGGVWQTLYHLTHTGLTMVLRFLTTNFECWWNILYHYFSPLTRIRRVRKVGGVRITVTSDTAQYHWSQNFAQFSHEPVDSPRRSIRI